MKLKRLKVLSQYNYGSKRQTATAHPTHTSWRSQMTRTATRLVNSNTDGVHIQDHVDVGGSRAHLPAPGGVFGKGNDRAFSQISRSASTVLSSEVELASHRRNKRDM